MAASSFGEKENLVIVMPVGNRGVVSSSFFERDDTKLCFRFKVVTKMMCGNVFLHLKLFRVIEVFAIGFLRAKDADEG